VAKLKKLWQFDFDPNAPKGDIHKFLSNRKEGPSDIYGMPVFADKRLYVAGGGDIFWGKNEAWLKCIDPTGSGDITTSGTVWTLPLDKHVMATPAVYNGLVFIADMGRKIRCIDAATGRQYWEQEAAGDFWASPLIADGKVYIGTKKGDFWVLDATREKKVRGTMDFKKSISGTATAANGTLYVATMTNLYALRKKAP
jgi:outer membrane protein assembly factor BamB